MAFPTSVNNMITDSISQSNVEVVGQTPAVSTGNLLMSTSQALGNAAHNATNAQQQTNITAQATTTQSVSTLFTLDTAATSLATMKIMGA